MAAYYGLYRATVVSAVDPLRQRRLLVAVADVPAAGSAWAAACVPPGSRATPKTGAAVWVQFEAGDPTRPVWVGVRPAAG